MTALPPGPPAEFAPFALLDLAMGSMVTQAISVAAQLRIAETLTGGPLPAAEIARRTDAHPEAVARLLRLLASRGIFAEREDGRFELTPMGDALRADAPVTMRDLAVLMGHPIHWEDWSELLYSVRTGEPALTKLRGMGAFEYLESNAEYGPVFFNGMGNLSATETRPVLDAYDFSGFGTVVDFCGGSGGLLAAVLQQHPGVRGILADPRVASNGAAGFLAEQGVAERCEIVEADLFGPAPKGGDAYILKHIVHDWPRDQALQILRNVRAAMEPGSRLLLMEMVVPDGLNEPHSAKQVDLWLMLLIGGRERTADQYADLLAEAGFELERVVGTAHTVSIVQARPV